MYETRGRSVSSPPPAFKPRARAKGYNTEPRDTRRRSDRNTRTASCRHVAAGARARTKSAAPAFAGHGTPVARPTDAPPSALPDPRRSLGSAHLELIREPDRRLGASRVEAAEAPGLEDGLADVAVRLHEVALAD